MDGNKPIFGGVDTVKTKFFKVLALLMIVSMVIPAMAIAQVPAADIVVDTSEVNRVIYDLPASQLVGAVDGDLLDQSGPIQIMIELQAEPTAQTFAKTKARAAEAEATRAAQAQLAEIEVTQQALLQPLADLDAQVLYRIQRVYNGIAAIADSSALDQIAHLPNVKAVHRLPIHQLDHATSVPMIGAPELWESSGLDLTGAGISIGVIDTGIDYLHAGFGGLGAVNPDLYSNNDTTIIGDIAGFPSAKVVGGYDFVGDAYDAGKNPVPVPDPDPMDCQGHGSHVAGTAAGTGVNLDGTTYTGVYPPATPFTTTFRIGPGVAPEAELYALRVFGCDGSTNVTALAIEWAADPNGDGDFSDHLDVINMSLGAGYGSAFYDASAVATDNAVLAGVAVVVSAGNSEDSYYVTGSPGVATRAMSTASVIDSSSVSDGFRVNDGPLAGVHAGRRSSAFDWTVTTTLPLSGTLVYPEIGTDLEHNQRTGCYDFTITNTNIITGNIVLLNWTEPSCGGSVKRTGKAFAAGAIGVLLADDSDFWDLNIYGSSDIPSLSIAKDVGEALAANLPLSMTFSTEYNNSVLVEDPRYEDVLSGFSSRGPRRGDSFLKPDIAAPGTSIFSVEKLSGDEGSSKGGTSMASPHAAGAMALVREMHPYWTPEELKALLMNTALNEVRTNYPMTSTIYGPSRVGAGRIDLPNASNTEVVAYNPGTPGAVSVSFGVVEVTDQVTLTRKIRVHNKGATPMTYTLSYNAVADIPGVGYDLAPATVVLGAFEVTDVSVTMTATRSLMRDTHDESINMSPLRYWMSEEAGYAVFTPTTVGAQALRVPLYAVARPASDMEANLSLVKIGETTAITLTGDDFQTGPSPFSAPPNVASLVTAFELQEESKNLGLDAGAPADLQYVGVTSDYEAHGQVISTTIFFAVSTYANWNSPYAGDTEFDIYMDVTLSGRPDFVMWNSVDGNDEMIIKLYNLSNDELSIVAVVNGVPGASLNTAAFNNSVMVLPVPAAALGMTNGGSSFNYWIRTYHRDASGRVDTSGLLAFDAGNPGIDFTNGSGGIPIWPDADGGAIPVAFDLAAYLDSSSKGVLLLHHHNATGNHAEVLDVTPFVIYLPLTVR